MCYRAAAGPKPIDALSLSRTDSQWTESTNEQGSILDSQELDALEDDFDEDQEAEAEAQAAESPTPVPPSKNTNASDSQSANTSNPQSHSDVLYETGTPRGISSSLSGGPSTELNGKKVASGVANGSSNRQPASSAQNLSSTLAMSPASRISYENWANAWQRFTIYSYHKIVLWSGKLRNGRFLKATLRIFHSCKHSFIV